MRQQIDDAAVGDDDRMVLEHGGARHDRNDPSRLDHQIDRVHVVEWVILAVWTRAAHQSTTRRGWRAVRRAQPDRACTVGRPAQCPGECARTGRIFDCFPESGVRDVPGRLDPPASMDQFAKETLPVSLEEEMRRSYLDYAMSVIVGRALPDVRDGLKPVHRRVLFAMHEANNHWNRSYVKCARVVGEVMGKYHPHGDNAIYDTLVRDGAGFFAALPADRRPGQLRLDRRRQRRGDALHRVPARQDRGRTARPTSTRKRSTSCRITTARNASRRSLPSKIPNLLINGSAGIAVGMATNIPPHNLAEVIDGCLALLRRPETTVDELIELIPGAGLSDGRNHLWPRGCARGLSHRPRPSRHARQDAFRGDRQGRAQRDHRRRAAVPGEQARAARAHRGDGQREAAGGHLRTSATSPTSRACAWCSS